MVKVGLSLESKKIVCLVLCVGLVFSLGVGLGWSAGSDIVLDDVSSFGGDLSVDGTLSVGVLNATLPYASVTDAPLGISDYDFLIYRDGSYYKAVNGSDNRVVDAWVSTNFSSVVYAADLAARTSAANRSFLKFKGGVYVVETKLIINKPHTYWFGDGGVVFESSLVPFLEVDGESYGFDGSAVLSDVWLANFVFNHTGSVVSGDFVYVHMVQAELGYGMNNAGKFMFENICFEGRGYSNVNYTALHMMDSVRFEGRGVFVRNFGTAVYVSSNFSRVPTVFQSSDNTFTWLNVNNVVYGLKFNVSCSRFSLFQFKALNIQTADGAAIYSDNTVTPKWYGPEMLIIQDSQVEASDNDAYVLSSSSLYISNVLLSAISGDAVTLTNYWGSATVINPVYNTVSGVAVKIYAFAGSGRSYYEFGGHYHSCGTNFTVTDVDNFVRYGAVDW